MPACPTSPVSKGGGGAASSSGNSIAGAVNDAATDSFESLLTQDAPSDSSDNKSAENDKDSGKKADLLAVSFWMQMMPVTPPPPALPPSVLTGDPSDPACGTTAPAIAGRGESGAGDDPKTGDAKGPRADGAVVSDRASLLGFKLFRAFGPAMPVNATKGGVAVTAGSPEIQATATIASEAETTPVRAPVALAPVAAESANDAPIAQQLESAGLEPLRSALPLTKVTKGPGLVADKVLPADASLGLPVPAAVSPDQPGPPNKAGTEANPIRENIAALPPSPEGPRGGQDISGEKYFLNTIQKEVAKVASAVGIGVAKLGSIMSTASARSKTPAASEVPTGVVFSDPAIPVATFSAEAPVPVSTVREAMAAVISAVDTLERKADVQQKSVELQLHVGDEKLGLRVELRDGAVHTTFRTESAEMSGALSREWHHVVQPVAAREIRLAEPVFSSSGSHEQTGSGSLGQGAAHHHEQHGRPSFASAFRNEFHGSAMPESAPIATPSVPVGSSQLLNALA